MIRQINVNFLRKGMFICGTDRKWIDIPFLRRKFLIKSDKQIDVLTEYCKFVYIDTAKGVDMIDPPETQSIAERGKEGMSAGHADADPDRNHNFYEEVYDKSQTVLAEVLNDVRLGRLVDNPKIRGVVMELMTCIVKDSQAMISLTRLKDKNDVLARKSVNVCILALAFGKHIGIPSKKMHTLGLGALLHDIGMVRIPNKILSKQQALTPAERATMEKHTEYGLALLAKSPEIPEDVLKIVYSHHEHIDGSGYPQQLQGKEIGLLARMVAIASVYEALTRERLYGETLSPAAALRYLYLSGKRLFDAHLVEKFIQALGIYPPGCVVELSTGELGVVVSVNPQNRLRPALSIVTDARKQLLTEEYALDLADRAAQSIKVVKPLDTGDPIAELIATLHGRNQSP